MRKIGLIVFILACCPIAQAQETGVPVFYVHYALLENLAFRETKMAELIKLREIAPEKAEFLTEFWRTRAMMANHVYTQDLIERYSERIAKAIPEKRKLAEKELFDKVSYVDCSYYYDHWTEINDMIVLNLERALKEAKESENDKK